MSTFQTNRLHQGDASSTDEPVHESRSPGGTPSNSVVAARAQAVRAARNKSGGINAPIVRAKNESGGVHVTLQRGSRDGVVVGATARFGGFQMEITRVFGRTCSGIVRGEDATMETILPLKQAALDVSSGVGQKRPGGAFSTTVRNPRIKDGETIEMDATDTDQARMASRAWLVLRDGSQRKCQVVAGHKPGEMTVTCPQVTRGVGKNPSPGSNPRAEILDMYRGAVLHLE